MSKQILIIHDDELFLTMMELRMEMEGLHATVTASSEEGMRLIKAMKPDLVLIPTRISPSISIELADYIRRTSPSLKIIPVDTYAMITTTLDASDSEMEAVFDKLAQFEVLITNIKAALGLDSDVSQ